MDQERRRFERITSRIVGNCLVGSTENHKFRSKIIFTRDISSAGARIVMQTDIKPGDYFRLILHLPTCFLPMLVSSRATWVKNIDVPENKVPNVKEAGVVFTRMEPPDESKINDFIAFKQKQISLQEIQIN